MARQEKRDDGRFSGYRLQTSAYVNRRDSSPFSNINLDLTISRQLDDFQPSAGIRSLSSVIYSNKPLIDAALYLNSEVKVKSILHLPEIVIKDTTNHTIYSTPSSPRASPAINHQPVNVSKQFLTSTNVPLSTSRTAACSPIHKPRMKTARLSVVSSTTLISASPQARYKSKRRRFSFEDDPNRLAIKMSLPCRNGCCYCAFTALLGPVKVYMTRADKPKKEPLLGHIKDGNGKAVIPVSRKNDVRGLVYDPISHSLYPPARGQRPLFKKFRQSKDSKQSG